MRSPNSDGYTEGAAASLGFQNWGMFSSLVESLCDVFSCYINIITSCQVSVVYTAQKYNCLTLPLWALHLYHSPVLNNDNIYGRHQQLMLHL